MDVKALIEACDREIVRAKARKKLLRTHRKILAGLPDGSLIGDQLDFDNLPHDKVIEVIRKLGGKWKKNRSYSKSDRIDYVREAPLDGLVVRCWQGEPPPSCRLVEYEEVIPEHVVPAQTVKRFKMVCTGHGDPMTEALAKANSSATNNQQPQSITESQTA